MSRNPDNGLVQTRVRRFTGRPSSRIRTILVPVNGLPYAECALPYALALARRSGAVVRIVHAFSRLEAIDPCQVSFLVDDFQQKFHEKRSYLRILAKRIARVSDVRLETVFIDNSDTEEALCTAAVGADLVVAASRRRGFLSRLWCRSNLEAIRRRLRIPLLQVQGYSSPVDLTGDPFPRRILVPLDGSATSRSILGPAKALARLDDTLLTLINVQDPAWMRGHFEHTTPFNYLNAVGIDLEKSSIRVSSKIVTTPLDPAPMIAKFAVQHSVDLIAIATRDDQGWSRMMRGSVADYLIQKTNLPVLVRGYSASLAIPKSADISADK